MPQKLCFTKNNLLTYRLTFDKNDNKVIKIMIKTKILLQKTIKVKGLGQDYS